METQDSQSNGYHRQLAGLDDFIEQERDAWKVPGVAIAITSGDEVIHCAGYGLRDVANNLPMTPRTVCPLASVTKSMTVSTLAVLARQGKLDWDTPIREYLPDFRLFNSTLTERVTPRDLVTHRTGLPRHDFVWYGASLSREEIYQRLRYLEPSKDLRAVYQYNNLMFMTAGLLAGRLAGTSWEEAIRSLLFQPLGMSRAGCSISDLLATDDFATGYEEDDDEQVHPSPYYDGGHGGPDPLGPAGSVVASVEELICYVQMHLGGGRFGETQVVAEADVAQMQSPQMVIPDSIVFPEIGHTQYGMGFNITQYRGHTLVQHGGNIDGFSTNLAFLPQHKVGLVVLCNKAGSYVRTLIAYRIIDQLLGLEPAPWSERFRDIKVKSKAAEKAAESQGVTARKTGTTSAHSIEDYTGGYTHPAYGTVEIRKIADVPTEELEIDYHGFTSPLRHFHYEVWETPQDKRNRLERTRIRFETDWGGDVASLSIPLAPQIADIVFARVADPAMSERSFLERLCGSYAISVQIFQVTLLDDGTLQLTQPGQTPEKLRPVRASIFEVDGHSGFRIEFVRDTDGAVKSLALQTPSGTYIAERKTD